MIHSVEDTTRGIEEAGLLASRLHSTYNERLPIHTHLSTVILGSYHFAIHIRISPTKTLLKSSFMSSK